MMEETLLKLEKHQFASHPSPLLEGMFDLV